MKPRTAPFANKSPTYKMLFQNMQSLNNKLDIFEAFITDDPSYKVIGISETWFTQDKLDLIQFSGYKFAASYCRSTRTGGGVCILIQDHIDCIHRTDITNMSIEYVIEVCATELIKENLLIISMYWNKREEDTFYQQLKLILKYINLKYSKLNIIIGGDFNINILCENQKSNQFLNVMQENKLTQHIKTPTRITPSTKTCLDLIFTNFEYNDMYTTVEELGFSDHNSTILHLNLPQKPKQTVWFKHQRRYNDKNIKKFKSKLQEINWNDIIKPEKDINANYEALNNILTTILNQCIPIQKTRLKTNFKKYWLSKGIKNSCKSKRLLKIFITKTTNPILTKYYKKYEKLLKKTIVTAKKLHFKNKMINSNNKVKTMWTIINERTNKKIKREKCNINLQTNKDLTSDPKEVANIFNNFFASIGTASTNNTGCKPKGIPVTTTVENSIFLSPVDPYEVNVLLKNLKNKSSYGVDGLPPTLFRLCADELTVPFHNLINQSFEEGAFPNLLKKALIKPIYKKNTKTDPNNYRPIALLPTASKLFEKAMCNRVYAFCEKHNIFNDCQNGFRKNRSTILAVYKYIQEALNIINNKKYAIGLLLDMTKAYDKVQFNILLNKLYSIGIRGKCHEWFASYLQHREQLVEIEYFNHRSNEIELFRSDNIPINASIPQGSVIGCFLFLVYINDLPNHINEPCVLFADDISILASCENNINLNSKLNSILNSTTSWMTQHNLEINFSKTKIITFHPRQKIPINIDYSFKNTKLEIVSKFTLLGLDIDREINWKSHINKLKAKLSKFSYALREIKKTTDLKTALVTYYAYGYAWLKYGVILWGNSTDAPTLFTIQKKLIRIIVNIEDTDSCKPHFKELKILTLPCLYIFEMCKFVRNHPEFYNKRQEIQNKISLRHKNRLNLPTSRLKMHSSSTYVMSIKLYNKLPEKIKNISKYSSFINKLKIFLLNKVYYNINEYLSDKL